jgi:WD40 repeat protein
MLPPRVAPLARLTSCFGIGPALLIVAVPLLAQDSVKADRNGDALPAGALARLGTPRWRHAEAVTFVAFLPDGKAILTGGLDNTLRLWDRATGKELRRFTLPVPTAPAPGRQPVRVPIRLSPFGQGQFNAALSRDGKVLAAALADNKVQLWDVASGKEIRQVEGPPRGIAGIAIAPDGKTLALRGGDRSIHLVSCETGREASKISQGPPGPVRIVFNGQVLGDNGGLAFSPDGTTLASTEFELDRQQKKTIASVRLSEVNTGKEIRKISAEQRSAASALAYSPDGKMVAFSYLNHIYLHETGTGKELHDIGVPLGVTALAFAPDGKTLAAKTQNRTVHLIDVTSGENTHRLGEDQAARRVNVVGLRFGGNDLGALAFSPDGKMIATGDGNTLRQWDAATGKEQPLAAGHRGPVSQVSVAADGKTLVSIGNDNVIRCWDLADGREIGAFHEPAGTTTMAVAPDGKTVACAGNGPAIQLIDVATGKPVRQLKGHAPTTAAIAFSPDGKLLASAGLLDSTIRLHDVVKRAVVRQIIMPKPEQPNTGTVIVRAGPAVAGLRLAFSADGRTLVAQDIGGASPLVNVGGNLVGGGNEGTKLRLWNVSTGQPIRTIALPTGSGVGSFAVAPDARTIAVENRDGTLSLYEAAGGRERAHLGEPAKEAPITATAGAFVAIRNPVAMRATESTLAFSPDGSRLVSKGPNRTARIWNVDTGKAIRDLKGHDGSIGAVAFTRDGKRVATGSADTTILVWDTPDLQRESAPTGPALTAEEAAQRWADLAGEDAAKAFAGIRRLAAHPQVAVPLVREHFKPAVPTDPKRLAKLVADLDSDDFTTRATANQELAKLGELAQSALEKVMSEAGTLERRRRAEALLAKLTGGALTPEQLRQVRAVEALERAATPEARQLLEALAKGAPGVLPTREAQAALGRLTAARP